MEPHPPPDSGIDFPDAPFIPYNKVALRLLEMHFKDAPYVLNPPSASDENVDTVMHSTELPPVTSQSSGSNILQATSSTLPNQPSGSLPLIPPPISCNEDVEMTPYEEPSSLDQRMDDSPPTDPPVGDATSIQQSLFDLELDCHSTDSDGSTEADESNFGASREVDEVVGPDADETVHFLRRFNIFVDPDYRQTICVCCSKIILSSHMYGHQKKEHFRPKRGQRTLKLPPKHQIDAALSSLGAENPLPIPMTGITAIPLVEVKQGIQCLEAGCLACFAGNRKRDLIYHHYARLHPHVKPPPKFEKFPNVRCQSSSSQRSKRFYFCVTPADEITSQAFSDVLAKANSLDLLNPSDVFHSSESAQERNIAYAQTRWDLMLEGVKVPALRVLAETTVRPGEEYLERLKIMVRQYYEVIVKDIPKLTNLTRRYILSYKIGVPHDRPFKRPQERGTIDKDSDYMSRFLFFLIRSLDTSIENFPIVLHPDTAHLLLHLRELLQHPTSTPVDLHFVIHECLWSILSVVSDDFLFDDLQCPFTRFLFASNIHDDYGTFENVTIIPPRITMIQWCFRATGVQQVIQTMETEGIDSQSVADYLCDSKPTLFNNLRQYMKLFSAISHRQKPIAKMNLNPQRTVISIDSSPIIIADFIKGINNALEVVENKVDGLFRGCVYQDLLERIDRSLIPDSSGQPYWFRDSVANIDCGYSFIKEPCNQMEEDRHRLLRYLCQDSRFFKMVPNVGVFACEGAMREWFSEVNEVIKGIFYLIVCTWGGGARGTELQHLSYANHPSHSRNILFINGILTVVTTYNKTLSITGVGKMIARSPAVRVSRLLVLVLWQVYWACAHLSLYTGMSKESSQRYLHEVFVLSGESMTSEKFSSTLGYYNSLSVGFQIKLADFRQLMATLLINFTHSCFYDEDDDEMRMVHESFGHSVAVGQKHYAVDFVNSATDLSSDLVARMQVVSFKWQLFIGLLHQSLKTKIDVSRAPTSNGLESSMKELDSLLRSHHNTLGKQFESLFESYEQRAQQNLRRELELQFTEFGNRLQRVSEPTTTSLPSTVIPRLSVHPHMRDVLSRTLGNHIS
ncbi:hypothetical protein E1B28_010717 [Marasmius oreades]|uniref:Uncharacterized protein n=1 Tax=Marasmius oreades TaxID=181124 RepID=A0A9P7USZ3_9AGAR|nr:uncharacterized protein E1B28_010717 [Marasmius oreades]KAG7091696.1 hypothetical protein E1B28_010717 [Marasmius oreades]